MGLEVLFPLGLTCYQWQVGTNSLNYGWKKILIRRRLEPLKGWEKPCFQGPKTQPLHVPNKKQYFTSSKCLWEQLFCDGQFCWTKYFKLFIDSLEIWHDLHPLEQLYLFKGTKNIWKPRRHLLLNVAQPGPKQVL